MGRSKGSPFINVSRTKTYRNVWQPEVPRLRQPHYGTYSTLTRSPPYSSPFYFFQGNPDRANERNRLWSFILGFCFFYISLQGNLIILLFFNSLPSQYTEEKTNCLIDSLFNITSAWDGSHKCPKERISLPSVFTVSFLAISLY